VSKKTEKIREMLDGVESDEGDCTEKSNEKKSGENAELMSKSFYLCIIPNMPRMRLSRSTCFIYKDYLPVN
jgi:hypothetical protein